MSNDILYGNMNDKQKLVCLLNDLYSLADIEMDYLMAIAMRKIGDKLFDLLVPELLEEQFATVAP